MRKAANQLFSYIFFVLLNYCLLFDPAKADYILTAPPRENSDIGKKTYEPLAQNLTKLLGDKVVYQQPTGWFDYAQKMRSGAYDIVFDGPHFAAWRLKHLHHIPVAVLPGTLDFLLITSVSDNEINKIQDLNGKKICGILSPNLGTSLIFDLFKNPVLQPELHEIKGGMKEVYNAFKRGECRAAILRNINYDRLPEEEKISIKIISKTKSLPNQTITVSQRLEKNARQIADFIVSKEGAIASQHLFNRYSKNAPYFELTNQERYRGIENLLEGVVWGW